MVYEYKKYNESVGWQTIKCERCGLVSKCAQHHVDRRRNSDRVVWLCIKCHSWVHANPAKAKEEGLYFNLVKIEPKVRKEKAKRSKCRKCKGIYVVELGSYICQFCRKPML